MTGNGRHTTYKNGDWGDGWLWFSQHALSWSSFILWYILFWNMDHQSLADCLPQCRIKICTRWLWTSGKFHKVSLSANYGLNHGNPVWSNGVYRYTPLSSIINWPVVWNCVLPALPLFSFLLLQPFHPICQNIKPPKPPVIGQLDFPWFSSVEIKSSPQHLLGIPQAILDVCLISDGSSNGSNWTCNNVTYVSLCPCVALLCLAALYHTLSLPESQLKLHSSGFSRPVSAMS